MTRVALVAGGPLEVELPRDYDSYVGVDAGCLAIIEAGLTLHLAVGDFDSVTATELTRIKLQSQRLYSSPAEKDDTDLELALVEIFKQWPEAEVTIYGALGRRLDHTLMAVFLPSHPSLSSRMRQLTLVDRYNRISFYPAGRQLIEPQPDFHYVAFLLEGQGQLTITGAKYNMDRSTFFQRKLYGSNEFVKGPIQVDVPSGYLVVIHSKDR